MALKLYGFPMSTATVRVMACLHEKGAEFDFVSVNITANEHKQPSFLSKNPFGQVPVLEDGDLTIFDSRAINAYLSHKYKDRGEDLSRVSNIKEASLVSVWIEVESQHFNPAIAPIIYEFFLSPRQGKAPDNAVIEAGVEKLGKVLDVYEAKLSQTKYLAGDFYCLADLNHLPYTIYLMKTPWASLINCRPHVKAWWEAISSRPASKKVAEGMNLDNK